MRGAIAQALGSSAQRAGQQQRPGSAKRRTPEQVLPAPTAGSLGHVIQMKATAEQAGRDGGPVNGVTYGMRSWMPVNAAMQARAKRTDRDRGWQIHGGIQEV